MQKVNIEVDSKWIKIVHSPLYWIVATLQGVAVTFAPLFLYWSGKGMFNNRYEWIIVPSCFATIFLVGVFYMKLGGTMVGALRKNVPASDSF